MKILICDGEIVNPGDLSWQPLEKLGECSIYDYTDKEELAERAKGFDAIISNKIPIRRNAIEKLPQLKYIGLFSTGYDIIDIDAASERGIPVCNVPGYSTMSVAQHVFALLLELTQHTYEHSASVKNGEWSKGRNFCFWEKPVVELDGLKFGTAGFGQIGQAAAKIARAFGMKSLAYNRNKINDPETKQCSAEELFAEADVISIHLPLTEETRGFVNGHRLSLMKPSAYLINTSRGPIVDESALSKALNEGKIAGAGLDVLSKEPPSPDNLMLSAKNCVITPHLAWASRAARSRVIDISAASLKAFMNGELLHAVNGDKL